MPNQLWVHKNHICVVRALKILKDEGHDLVVAVTGNPQDMRHSAHFNALMQEVSAADLSGNFKFLGVVPYEHVLALMQSAVALVNPSRCEGWSTTVEEAKSSGTPLILSNLGVHREQAGNAALYFSPDAPHELAARLREFQILTPEERATLASHARTDAVARLAQFAGAFCDLVSESLHRSQQRMQIQ